MATLTLLILLGVNCLSCLSHVSLKGTNYFLERLRLCQSPFQTNQMHVNNQKRIKVVTLYEVRGRSRFFSTFLYSFVMFFFFENDKVISTKIFRWRCATHQSFKAVENSIRNSVPSGEPFLSLCSAYILFSSSTL